MAIEGDGVVDSQFYDASFTTPGFDPNKSTGFTMVAWVRFDNATVSPSNIIVNCNNGNSASIQLGPSGVEFWRSTAYLTNSQVAVTTGWHHVAYRMSAGARTTADPTVWDAFLDGSKTTIDATFSGEDTPTATGDCTNIGLLGSSTGATSFEFDGAVDTFAAWEKPLSDGEIAMLASGRASHDFIPDLPNISFSFSRQGYTESSNIKTFRAEQGGDLLLGSKQNTGTSAGVGGAGLMYQSTQILPFPPLVTGATSKSLSYTGTGTSAFSRLASLSKDLTYTGQGTLAYAKALGKVLAYTATGSVAFARQIAISLALNFLGIGTVVETNTGAADLEGAINPLDALPRDIPRIREFIAAQGGPTNRSINDDYRDALCLAVGLTLEEALNVSIDDAWKLYAIDRGLDG